MTMLIETNFSEVGVLSEAKQDGTKDWFIEGIFAQADVVNRNGRRYPGAILEASMRDYDTNYVSKMRAVGEAEHPNTTKVNIDRISHVIMPGTLKESSPSNWSAKAKILNTPCGNIVKGLLEGGVQIGVSTRAGGSVKNVQGIMEVQKDLKMSAIDIVFSPSAPDALVTGLMEGAEYLWDSISEMDTKILEALRDDLDTNKKYKLAEERLKTFNRLMEAIRGK